MRESFHYAWQPIWLAAQFVSPGANYSRMSRKNAGAAVRRKHSNGSNGSPFNWSDIHREKRTFRSVRRRRIEIGSREVDRPLRRAMLYAIEVRAGRHDCSI